MPPKRSSARKPAASGHRAGRRPALPEWDLSDLYPGMDSPALSADLAALKRSAAEFGKAYGGKVEGLSGKELGKALFAYEKLQTLMGRLGSYAQLQFATASTTPAVAKFYQDIQERLTEAASVTLFFTLALNKISEEDLRQKLKDSGLAHYAPYLRDVRAFRPYQLDDEQEKLLLEKQVSGRSAWSRLFDETLAGMRFPIGQKRLTEAEVMHLLSSRDAQARKKAALSIGDTFKERAPLFALITNTLAKDKEIEDRRRGFKRPISSRNVSNYIEDEVVDALLAAVTKAYPDLSHRYYALKARWFGRKKLEYWDRNAPLPFDADRTYTWKEAVELVLAAYRRFSPKLAEVGTQFFDHRWIDAPPKPGKASGAFAHPTVPGVHPYLLLNFQGKSRDVMTLAHELGHGVHQVLSARRGMLMADTPLTLAETASVFGEQLAFREMLSREDNARRKKALIAAKVEDMLNTVVRQAAFCKFEILVHNARAQGELTAEQICEFWLQVQSESLGPAIKLHGNYRYFWTYIPHFIHSPFYVYAYAFGDCLVNSLYAEYERSREQGKAAEFEKKYLAMLEAGGTLRHKELLAPFGLNAADPKFWQRGLGIISGFIDELGG